MDGVFHKLFFFGLSLAVSVFLTSCSQKKDIDISKLGIETESPEKLYYQGLANIKAKNLPEAARKFDAVNRISPFSEWARKSLVMSVFVKYKDAKYNDSITTANSYIKQYPRSQDAAYIQYLIGLCYYNQINDVTLDQRSAILTIQAMEQIINDHPDSEYVKDAKAKLLFAKDQLAGKEMQVGRYYLERREYLAAISRFRVVVEKYSTTNQIEEALARLAEAYYAMGIMNEVQVAAAVLHKNYPNSIWYADILKLLKSVGLQPDDKFSSWISKASKKCSFKSSSTNKQC
ncbi:competence lipoprotein ComL [Liberibacter crescens BT-1]|uniref:Outer membrane protein assembly factor BamD n=1 Tax=Liberibacter crescens (strain BT-1) TaxID=1215343 RepID=L0EW46_LIBCB|nr:outer membrane protein assembly factor BamD [Liberibacter crescens]AGA64591.1 competence lipoprotein ComL [Liberibacter crescens BT-1]AMC13347.1 membrane protein [Liberibacter crescens]